MGAFKALGWIHPTPSGYQTLIKETKHSNIILKPFVNLPWTQGMCLFQSGELKFTNYSRSYSKGNGRASIEKFIDYIAHYLFNLDTFLLSQNMYIDCLAEKWSTGCTNIVHRKVFRSREDNLTLFPV